VENFAQTMNLFSNLKESKFRFPILLCIYLIVHMGGILLHSHFGPWGVVARGAIFIGAGAWSLYTKSLVKWGVWGELFAVGVLVIGLFDLHAGLLELGIVHF
jgi:hypothetical protein